MLTLTTLVVVATFVIVVPTTLVVPLLLTIVPLPTRFQSSTYIGRSWEASGAYH